MARPPPDDGFDRAPSETGMVEDREAMSSGVPGQATGNPVLAVFAPFYRLFPRPVTLLDG